MTGASATKLMLLRLPYIRLPQIVLPLMVLPLIQWRAIEVHVLTPALSLPAPSRPAFGAVLGLGAGEAAWGVTPWSGGAFAYEFGGLAVGLLAALLGTRLVAGGGAPEPDTR